MTRGQITYHEAYNKDGVFLGKQKQIALLYIHEDPFRPVDCIVSAWLPIEATHEDACEILKKATATQLDGWSDTEAFQKWVNDYVQ